MCPAFSTSACLSVPLNFSSCDRGVLDRQHRSSILILAVRVWVRLELPLGQGLFSGTVLFHFLKSHALLHGTKSTIFRTRHEVSLRLCARNPRCVLVLEFMVFGDQRHPDALEFRQIFAEALLEL